MSLGGNQLAPTSWFRLYFLGSEYISWSEIKLYGIASCYAFGFLPHFSQLTDVELEVEDEINSFLLRCLLGHSNRKQSRALSK